MLSIGRIGAGDGYRYLTEQTASQDAPRHGEVLAAYYDQEGMPPGVWLGAGAANLGLAGEVDEERMGRLFGRCEHPFEDRVDPKTGEVAPAALGRRMAVFRTVDERIADRLAGLTADQRAEVEATVRAEEVARGTPQAVSGFDLTFSAPKSVSVVWGLGDDAVRDALRGAHETAWQHAVAHLEGEVASTRLGRAGVAQVATRGITGAAFEHWFSRAGDPQLHTHVAVSAMVQTVDGRWRRLDSRALFRASAAVGERYTAESMNQVEARLGWGWEHRSTGRGVAVPELAGMPASVVKAFSTRSSQVDANVATMVAEYRADHGVEPSRSEVARLAQQAVLEGRPAPSQKSWTARQGSWRAQAAQLEGIGAGEVAGWLAARVGAGAPGRARPSVTDVPVDTETLAAWVAGPGLSADAPGRLGVAAAALGALEDRHATWSAHQMDRAVGIVLREGGWRVDETSIVAVRDTMVAHRGVVRLTPDVPAGPAVLEAAGVGARAGVFARVGEDRWTSGAVLAGEARLQTLAAATPARSGPHGTMREVLDATEARLARLETERSDLVDRAGAARAEETRLRAANAQRAAARPAHTEAAGRVEQTRKVEARVDVILARLGAGGLRKARQGERDALHTELVGLLKAAPGANSPASWRAQQHDQILARAGAVDARAVADVAGQAEVVAGEAGRAERRTAGVDAEVVALRAQHDQLVAAASEVVLGARAEGLSVEQAGAVARLADPGRALDALIGPAGAGKTTTLAALAGVAGDQGRAVIALAPTAAAAGVLGEDLGVRADTLDKALVEWRAGRALPGPGCMVIVDEASMAATPKLVEAVEMVVAAGGTVRLAGDPRQLAAVGAGGGLGIVANAAASPRLSGLHRFTQTWEGPATLRLRDRDPDVIGDYAAAGRVTGGARHAMIGETFGAWAEAATGGDAIMVAGDNTTVAALSAMARAARVAAGQVTEAGVALANGATAGVGDVIATRRNDRTIAVGDRADHGGYVRNRDRWTVVARGDDGSLEVAHLRTGGVARLPAGYVAAHVELGYALTAHGAQGMTVDEAHVLVAAGDPAALVYVGMTRGRAANHAHVVIDEPADEPGHLPATQGGPVEVLAGVLGHEGPTTATAVALDEVARQTDPGVLAARYLASVDEDRRTRVARAADTVGSDLLAGDDAWQVLDAARRLEQAGRNPARVIAELGADVTANQAVVALDHAGILTADEAGDRVIAAMTGPPQRRQLTAGILPPVSAYADPAVTAWAAAAGDQLDRLRAALATDLATADPPPWAAALGARPDNPAGARTWAAEAAQVALYRQTAGITGTDLLGPHLPAGNPLNPARHQADLAARAARHITSPQPQVSRTPTARHNPLPPHRTYDYDYHPPHHGPERDGPDLGM